MKIKNLAIRGFRGFNDVRSIDMHSTLTLIAAANSYGKTSISEGFEWLLYGTTSKVDHADSKDEYKGSYRNCHLPQTENPSVTLTTIVKGSNKVLNAILDGDDIRRSIDGNPASAWDFTELAKVAPKPFILQHALKNLLLAKPVDRFNKFAVLLGLEELGIIQKDLLAFCTKPPLPSAVDKLLADIRSLEMRVAAQPQLASITKLLKKGSTGLKSAFQEIRTKAKAKLQTNIGSDSLLPELLRVRDEAVGKIFKGSISLESYTLDQEKKISETETFFLSAVTQDVIQNYLSLAGLKSGKRILDRAKFYGLAEDLMTADVSCCPLCGQRITEEKVSQIRKVHQDWIEKTKEFEHLEDHRKILEESLERFKKDLATYQTLVIRKMVHLTRFEEISLSRVKALLIPKHQEHFNAVDAAIGALKSEFQAFSIEYEKVSLQISSVAKSIADSSEDQAIMEELGLAFVRLIAAAKKLRETVNANSLKVMEADRFLKHELDILAGTQDVSLLIELLEKEKAFEKKVKIEQILESLKSLKTDVDQFVSEVMLNSISGEFTSDVMDWYSRIRTSGDPDVHFAGFDMKKTSQGGRVQVKASSYGRDLVSAVSSLSESKLNALGLCISIAINLRSESPFKFLIIDDPIQSWDSEHEIQFIGVIRELINRGKQVVLLSHNHKWINQVRTECADLNGIYYEITGYVKSGPVIQEKPWTEAKQRLKTINAMIQNPSADKVQLQQAEEELRQVIHQLTCEFYFLVKHIRKSPHNLNGDQVRAMLTECGVEPAFVNKIYGMFGTVDDAHHANDDYSPNRNRIREYYGRANTLADKLNEKRKEPKANAAAVMSAMG